MYGTRLNKQVCMCLSVCVCGILKYVFPLQYKCHMHFLNLSGSVFIFWTSLILFYFPPRYCQTQNYEYCRKHAALCGFYQSASKMCANMSTFFFLMCVKRKRGKHCLWVQNTDLLHFGSQLFNISACLFIVLFMWKQIFIRLNFFGGFKSLQNAQKKVTNILVSSVQVSFYNFFTSTIIT